MASANRREAAMNALIRFSLALCAVFVAGCAGTAPPKPAPAATAAAAAPQGDALYRALGGQEGIGKVVDTALVEIHNDKRIAFFFEKTDLADLRRLLVEQICAATGGPCTYSGRSMEEAHSGLNLTDADFDAFVEDLVRAMDSQKVPKDVQKPLLGLLGPMRPQVVGQ
jgi:hemoglobin